MEPSFQCCSGICLGVQCLIVQCLWEGGVAIHFLWPMGLLSLGAILGGVKIRLVQVYSPQETINPWNPKKWCTLEASRQLVVTFYRFVDACSKCLEAPGCLLVIHENFLMVAIRFAVAVAIAMFAICS